MSGTNVLSTTRKTIDVIALILGSTLAESTKKQYVKVVVDFLATGSQFSDPEALADFSAQQSTSRRSYLKAALKMWAEALAIELKGMATSENVLVVQASLYRLEALQEKIKVKKSQGQKLGLWLSQAEVKKLIASCDASTTRGFRDKIVLGLMVGAGPRRRELIELKFSDMSLRPIEGKFRTVLQIIGKGNKLRTVPIKDRLAADIERWGQLVGTKGRVVRAIDQRRDICESLSSVGVFNIVSKAGVVIGKPTLAPHDLRRTYAQLGYEAGVPITQISKLLGHSSVTTTQRYLNLDLDLRTTIGDFIPYE